VNVVFVFTLLVFAFASVAFVLVLAAGAALARIDPYTRRWVKVSWLSSSGGRWHHQRRARRALNSELSYRRAVLQATSETDMPGCRISLTNRLTDHRRRHCAEVITSTPRTSDIALRPGSCLAFTLCRLSGHHGGRSKYRNHDHFPEYFWTTRFS
jgi:hypothetical protein